jgi:hypothetical protein
MFFLFVIVAGLARKQLVWPLRLPNHYQSVRLLRVARKRIVQDQNLGQIRNLK